MKILCIQVIFFFSTTLMFIFYYVSDILSSQSPVCPAPSVTPWDFGTSLSMGVSPGSSTSMINQAWTLPDQLASPMCTPHFNVHPLDSTPLLTRPPPPSSVEMVSQTLREACGTVCNEDPIPGERSPHSETQIDPQVYASHREAMRHQSAASETATRTFKCSVNYMLCRNYFFL